MGIVKKRVAIVGFGFMGHMHYGAWKKQRGAKVVAVCDSNLAQITAKVGGNLAGADNSGLAKDVKVYADFDEMLAKEPLDVVDVTLPTLLHPPTTIKALAKGVNVLCEKPMAIDARAAATMVAAAKKSKAKLMIAQCVRYWPEYVALKEMVDSGRHGRVIAADFTRFSPAPGWQNGGKSWFLDEKKSGGVALDMHLHDVDEIHHLFGMPKSVSSSAHRHPDGWTDFIATTYGYPGMVVTSSSSWAMAPSFVWESGFRVVFEKAVACCNSHNDKPFTVYPEKGKPFTPKTPKATGYEAEIKAFLAYLDGDASGATTPESACDSVRIVDAEKKSARLGRAVKP
ncbi:MAG: Gfo/Idh/MocA family oxidoreductase [Kiritimatiellae bacterium]|nr:Gfo/Idh/MocA family oxidoreductase [Kiritimatiellia bacterium]